MDSFAQQLVVSSEVRKLNDIFVENRLYRVFSKAFNAILADLLLDIEKNPPKRTKSEGIVLYGDSGSGKSTTVEYVLDNHTSLRPKRVVRRGVERITKVDVCAIKTPSPATLKSVGQNILEELGYDSAEDPMNLSRKEAHYIWGLVRRYLKKSGVRVLFIDEAQDFIINSNRLEIEKVISTLKSLLQDKEWPVCVVLAGMPELDKLVRRDNQLVNRTVRISCKKLITETDKGEVVSILAHYASAVGLGIHENLRKAGFVRRLLHASGGDYGKTIQELIRALKAAIERRADVAELADFADGYRAKHDVVDAANPYLVPDYLNILVPNSDASALLHSEGVR